MRIVALSLFMDMSDGGTAGAPYVPDHVEGLAGFGEVTLVQSDRGQAVAEPTPDSRSVQVRLVDLRPSLVGRSRRLTAWRRRLLGFDTACSPRRTLRGASEVLRGEIAAADVIEINSGGRFLDLAFIPELRRINRAAPIVVNCLDVLSDPNGPWVNAAGTNLPAVLHAGRTALQRRRERSLLDRADLVCAFHEHDRSLLTSMGVRARIEIVPPPMPMPPLAPLAAEPVVLFVGTGRPANVDAVRWFLERCWERVRSLRPDATFVVAGQGQPSWLEDLDVPGLVVAGAFDDIDALYRSARVVVAPLGRGAGIKYKVLEGLLHGIPVVATPVAAAGIDDMIGLGSFAAVTDDPIAFSDRVVDLLASEEEAGTVGRRGREAIGARCSADVVAAQVRGLYLELIGRTDR